MAGQMSNINRRGETSMMFHALPYVLDHDPHSVRRAVLGRVCTGDYGLGFFGHSLESAAYFVNHPTFGPVCYLCDTAPFPVPTNSTLVTIFPRDSYRARVFVEPLAYYFVAQSGTIANVVVDFKAKSIAVQFDDAAAGYEGGSVREKLFTHFHVQVGVQGKLPASGAQPAPGEPPGAPGARTGPVQVLGARREPCGHLRVRLIRALAGAMIRCSNHRDRNAC
eukprot:scaffold415_cov362-Prasinococcus_capsulatus_cf.AAC.21